MSDIPVFASIVLYVLIGTIGFSCILLWYWQLGVLRGKAFKNPDGSFDDWHKEKTHYGISLADTLISCPLGVVGAVLAFFGSRWGFYLLALVAFFFVWANVMTTATSLKFERFKIGFAWLIGYPFGILVGLLYLIMTFAYFDELYGA